MVEISDFGEVAEVQSEIIDRFQGRIPDDIIELWREYGINDTLTAMQMMSEMQGPIEP
ncbi:MAG TPA: hypothetical protein VK095_11505 [Beutenbergiaceae bacterium]|nr:hypothetical protein [Beutenbergiaceae bacterium]